MILPDSIARQIDAAFDFRGHVTVSFTDGSSLEGYLCNRELSPLNGEAYIEVMVKDSDELRRRPAASVKSIALTGKNFAAPFVPPAPNKS